MLSPDEILAEAPEKDAETVPAPATTPGQEDPVSADYVRRTVAGVLGDLDKLEALAPGDRTERDDGWDSGCFAVACQLVRAANSGTDYTIEQAEKDFKNRCPTDDGFGPGRVAHKWSDALEKVGDDPLHPQNPSADEDFGPYMSGKPEPGRGAGGKDELRELIDREKLRQQARQIAARELKAEGRESTIPPIVTLDALASEPDDAPVYFVEQVWPMDGHIVLAAQFKAGKTTLVGNVTRAIVDGVPLLNRFAPMPGQWRTAIIDDELSRNMLRRWLTQQGIVNQDRVSIVPLRGRVSSFDILDEDVRHQWADLLRGHQVLILDCLRPLMDALGLDEDHDAGRILDALDSLVAEAGIPNLLVVHHMGHSGERSRGDSRILDWPDATWKLTKEHDQQGNTEDAAPRYFSAYGRDVDVPEDQMDFDPRTQHVRLSGVGSRKTAKASRDQQKATQAVLKALSDYQADPRPVRPEGLSGKELGDATGIKDSSLTKARDQLVENGVVGTVPRHKQGGGFYYKLAENTEPGGAK